MEKTHKHAAHVRDAEKNSQTQWNGQRSSACCLHNRKLHKCNVLFIALAL